MAHWYIADVEDASPAIKGFFYNSNRLYYILFWRIHGVWPLVPVYQGIFTGGIHRRPDYFSDCHEKILPGLQRNCIPFKWIFFVFCN